jgi:hypothetical protein
MWPPPKKIKLIFMVWKDFVAVKKAMRDIREEELSEEIYAAENGMDSVYWCWNCKYHECDQHP